FGAAIHMQMLHLHALQRAARDHPFHRLFDHTLRMVGFQPLADRAALDAAGVTGVVVEDRLVGLIARHPHFPGVHHDDVVAAIDVRSELRLVLAAQVIGDDDGKAPEDDALGIDQHPVLLHLRRFDRKCGLEHGYYLCFRWFRSRALWARESGWSRALSLAGGRWAAGRVKPSGTPVLTMGRIPPR